MEKWPQDLAKGDRLEDGFVLSRDAGRADFRNLVTLLGINIDGTKGRRELNIIRKVEVTD